MKTKTIKELDKVIRQSLAKIYPPEEISGLISLIFEKKVNLKKTDILLNADKILDQKTIDEVMNIVDQLKKSKPIQYILGEADFYDLTLRVNPNVLIPRQETEELVDWIIKDNKDENHKILDIGTGSGCIAITLARHLEGSEVEALDTSNEIIDLVKKNAEKNSVQLQYTVSDILSDNQRNKRYDIIVSNPPYVLESEKRLIKKNILDYEPEEALFVKETHPLIYYEKIADFAFSHLKRRGKLYFEINENKGKEVYNMLSEYGFNEIEIRKDINGKDRMIKAIKK